LKNDIHGFGLIRSRRFWVVWLSYMLGQGSTLLVVDQMGSIIQSLIGSCTHPTGKDGSVPDLQFLVVVLFGLVNALGRFTTGPLSKCIPAPRLFTVLLICVAFVYYGLAEYVQNESVAVMTIAIIAFLFGGINTMSALLTASEFGDAHFSTNYGYITFAPGVASIFYNLYPGVLYDHAASLEHCTLNGIPYCFGTSCYQHAFVIAAAGAMTAAGMSFLLWWKPEPPSPTSSMPYTSSTRFVPNAKTFAYRTLGGVAVYSRSRRSARPSTFSTLTTPAR